MHWEPDLAVVEAVVAGRARLAALAGEDRAVVVAELTARGESAAQIAARLGCSSRQVKRIRAWPLTQTLERARVAEAEVERLRSVSRADGSAEVERLRAQVAGLESALGVLRRVVGESGDARRRNCVVPDQGVLF